METTTLDIAVSLRVRLRVRRWTLTVSFGRR
ncbi:hypothetical protein J2847_005860 [Azospirillum agricola]|nr:hypothetical protein [Azospirillum agricola]